MSLPSKAIFFNNKKEIYRVFINCGWFLSDNAIIKVLKKMEYPDEWDEVFLYGDIYTKENVEALIKIDEVLRDFWKDKFSNFDKRKPNFSLKIPEIKNSLPKLIAKEILSVQPLGGKK